MTTDAMIEAVAKHAFEARASARAWEDAPESGREFWRKRARNWLAGIDAAGFKVLPRDPSYGVMDEAPRRNSLDVGSFTAAEVWRVMWDASE